MVDEAVEMLSMDDCSKYGAPRGGKRGLLVKRGFGVNSFV